jgi:hypothetical protein
LALQQQKRLMTKWLWRRKSMEKMALQKKNFDEKTQLEQRKLELQERQLDDKVMTMDLSGMSEVQQQYYKRMQEEILAQRFGRS